MSAMICKKCGDSFSCDADTGNCWCQEGAPALPVPKKDSGVTCYCPECLEKVREEQANAS